MPSAKTLRTCPKGHQYYKSSDCPVCPQCEKEDAPPAGFMTTLSGPARRALETAGITTIQQLAKHTRKEILSLHGMGPASLPKLNAALAAAGLDFRSS